MERQKHLQSAENKYEDEENLQMMKKRVDNSLIIACNI